MLFTPGWHAGDAGACLWAVHGTAELRVFHSCGILHRLEWRWGCCELRLGSTPPAGLQMVPSTRRRFARKDLAWVYPESGFRVNAF